MVTTSEMISQQAARVTPYPVALELIGPSGKRMTVGKIFTTPKHGWLFYFETKDGGALRKLDSIAVAPEVLDWLEARGITAIHAYDKPAKKLYVADVNTFRKHGVKTAYFEGVRLQLPRHYCKAAHRDYKPLWIDLVVSIKAGR
ncbi:MAG: hypothetical protein M1343_08200 [Chloroflexi bacterium]|nr:hypothetical protein [Chloroflexota bacterium]